jgi:hypothetical protein
MLQAPVEVAVIGLALHQACPLLVADAGDGRDRFGLRRSGLFEQAIQQGF